jgi:HNH endonuclease
MPSDFRPSKRITDPELLKRFRLEHANEPCEICERRSGVHPHHKIFRSQGGDDVESNLLWVCLSCHDSIHADRLSRYDFQ